ncbi:hypothetical protein [Halocalculus aciditolerans]|uniref:hypothetical protein n=1 Tax=Halocalculus aciditolerans TaxID=1383812 RepID=UPI0016679E97|nr:hypothetical protein [Halocalculus aciditolerans]
MPTCDGGGKRPVRFERADDGLGVVVTDTVEERSVTVHTDQPPSFAPSDPDSFVAPLDDAVTFYANELSVEGVSSVSVFDERGDHVRGLGAGGAAFPRGTYYLNVQSEVQLYIRVFDTAIETQGGDAGTSQYIDVSAGGPTRVEVGARSRHERPAATITVGDDPEDAMAAVSYLGSGMKEWSAERSWPTIRGHPPAIERGGGLHVPDDLSKPETGVRVCVPKSHAAVYRVAPLAYYLGATVEPADGAATVLCLENGYEERLGTGRSVERRVDDLLARCLFLDSLVRIGGYYEFERYEYETVGGRLPFYPPELYDATLSEQLMEYLDVSSGDIEPYLPEWPLTAVLRDAPADVELLPYLVNDLARVHVTPHGEATGTPKSSVPRSMIVGDSSTESPARTAALSVDAYERGVDAVIGERAEVVVVAAPETVDLVETVSADRLAQNPSVACVDDRSRAAVADALERDADVVLVGVAASNGTVACRDGGLSLTSLDVDASTVVFTDGDAVSARRAVDAGALDAVALAGDSERAGRVAGYLAAGCTHTDAVRAAAADAPWWLAGDPQRVVASDDEQVWMELRVDSVAPDEHDVTYTPLPRKHHRLGSVVWVQDDAIADVHSLVGVTVSLDAPVSTETVLELTAGPEYLLTLNGERIHDRSRVTEALVRDSAERALAETAPNDDGPREESEWRAE